LLTIAKTLLRCILPYSGANQQVWFYVKQHPAPRDLLNFAPPVISRVACRIPAPVRRLITYLFRAAILTIRVLLTNVPATGYADSLFLNFNSSKTVFDC
jgi:hypothetical protein